MEGCSGIEPDSRLCCSTLVCSFHPGQPRGRGRRVGRTGSEQEGNSQFCFKTKDSLQVIVESFAYYQSFQNNSEAGHILKEEFSRSPENLIKIAISHTSPPRMSQWAWGEVQESEVSPVDWIHILSISTMNNIPQLIDSYCVCDVLNRSVAIVPFSH